MFPLDPLVGGVLGNIGLEAEIQQGFAISSTLASGNTTTTYKNIVHDYAGGGRYRFTFGSASDFYVSVTGGEDAFTFTGRSATNVLLIPDTIYHYVRPGLGLHLDIGGGLGVSVAGGYRAVLNNAGAQFQQFFPRATVAGADAELVAPLRGLADVRGAGRPRVAPLLVRHALGAGRHLRRRRRGRPVVRLHGAHRHPHRQQQRPQGRRGAPRRHRRRRRPKKGRGTSRPTRSRPATANRKRRLPPSSKVPRALIHLDMDAFYASVEQRDNPQLRGRPVIVGGHAHRGVVLAASYEVRPFGVRSAMPMSRALRLAPDAVVVRPRFDVYSDVSSRVFDILQTVTPLYEPLSLDEAFLDVTASRSLFGTPAEIARGLRRRIADELGLPASAGIAAVKLVAKIASDLAKPNGQLEVPADGGAAFLAPLPVARLPGIGPKSAKIFDAMGIATVGELVGKGLAFLEQRFGPGGRDLWERAQAIDPRPVIPDRDAKSVGAEETFDEDLTGVEALRPRVHAQALRVAHRLRRAGVRARTVQLKLKRSDFTLVTRRVTLDEPTDDGQTIYREAARLLEREPPRPTRLTGVSAQNLLPAAAPQLGLFHRRRAPPTRSTARSTPSPSASAPPPSPPATSPPPPATIRRCAPPLPTKSAAPRT